MAPSQTIMAYDRTPIYGENQVSDPIDVGAYKTLEIQIVRFYPGDTDTDLIMQHSADGENWINAGVSFDLDTASPPTTETDTLSSFLRYVRFTTNGDPEGAVANVYIVAKER